jgi:hypothetical protein
MVCRLIDLKLQRVYIDVSLRIPDQLFEEYIPPTDIIVIDDPTPTKKAKKSTTVSPYFQDASPAPKFELPTPTATSAPADEIDSVHSLLI